ncbi:MAG TPA: hypothetical protein VHE11_16435 [Steroidobacteraceae bacterium]|nr:hypothetical protein [Steroidobacteraceae bacterium]
MPRPTASVSARLRACLGRHRFLLLIAAAMGALVLTACSRHAPSGVEPASTAASDTDSTDEHDPCSLLDPKEVEAALGSPLATPPFRTGGGSPSADGEQCAYEDAHFHRILVDVDWDGATFAWKMMGNIQTMINKGPTKGMLHLADGSDLAGTWDEARVQGCCTFATLLGDQSVTIDAENSNVGIPAAAKLADAALKRLDKPLAIDGNGGVGPAKAYEASHRPKRRDACSLLTRAEAEAIIGPLSADPRASGDTCEYDRSAVGRMGGNVREVLEIEAHWSFGYQELNQNISLLQGFAKGFTAGLPGGKNVEAALRGGQLPASPYWEAAYAGGTRSGGLAAVKNDVMIGVNGLAIPREQTLAVLQKVMSKL